MQNSEQNSESSKKLSSGPGRVFAIGDVHGCASELAVLIRKLGLSASDTVVFLGDYIDRGPDSRGVVEQIIGLSKKCHVVALKGNHEAMFLDFLESPESPGAGLFILNGGAATLASYSGPAGSFEIPQSHLEFFYSLRLCYETATHFFVHAGVPVKSLQQINLEADEMTMLWGRQPFLSSSHRWEKMIVHGHTPVEKAQAFENRINVDTGCVYDGQLTAVELPGNKFHQVPKGVKREGFIVPRDPGGQRIAVRYQGQLPVHAVLSASKHRIEKNANKVKPDFVTLNFNQFGILMKDQETSAVPKFVEGDEIEGFIGHGEESDDRSIRFQGRVVRVESRGGVRLYGIKIERSSEAGGEGHEWIRD